MATQWDTVAMERNGLHTTAGTDLKTRTWKPPRAKDACYIVPCTWSVQKKANMWTQEADSWLPQSGNGD